MTGSAYAKKQQTSFQSQAIPVAVLRLLGWSAALLIGRAAELLPLIGLPWRSMLREVARETWLTEVQRRDD